MSLHPGVWLVWLGAVATFAFAVSNPLYLLVAGGAVLLVHLAAPPDPSPAGRAVRVFLVVGGVLLLARLVLVSFVAGAGPTELFAIPRIELPRVLGGFGIGGPVTAEVLVVSATDGLRLILVLLGFGVFNARMDLSSVIRMVPAAFRDAGLVVSIAAAFVPGILRTVRDVRDAQRLRGERGLRMLAPSLAVPILGIAVERAFLLAESMDSRGYGRGQTPPRARAALVAGLVAVVAATPLWVSGRTRLASVAALAGGIALVAAFRWIDGAAGVTRLQTPRWRRTDVVVASAVAAAGVLVVVAGSAVAYSAYPVVRAPGFDLAAGSIGLVLAAPALADVGRSPRVGFAR